MRYSSGKPQISGAPHFDTADIHALASKIKGYNNLQYPVPGCNSL
jgi:hypothetical protein